MSRQWVTDRPNILSPENLLRFQEAFEEGIIFGVHWFYYGGGSPDHCAFITYKDFLGYLKSRARPGDLFELWSLPSLLKTDSQFLTLNIYRRRAEHLQHYSTAHAQQLRDDVVALCNALAATYDENCRFWIFSVAPNSDYTVFEGTETGRILGCVFSKDKRLTPPDEWDNLWRGNNTR